MTSNDEIYDHLSDIGLRLPMAGVKRAVRRIEDDDDVVVFRHAFAKQQQFVFLRHPDSMGALVDALLVENFQLSSQCPDVQDLVFDTWQEIVQSRNPR